VTFDVRSLAARKHQETSHDLSEWTSAFETARMSLKLFSVDYHDLELIAIASRAPSQFTSLVRLIYQFTKSHPNTEQITATLLNQVSKSPFSLADWIESIDYFYNWLTKNQRKIDFLSMLSYLECCVASPDGKESGQTLAALLEDMLDFCGYEAG
jgi:hypothetical protein